MAAVSRSTRPFVLVLIVAGICCLSMVKAHTAVKECDSHSTMVTPPEPPTRYHSMPMTKPRLRKRSYGGDVAPPPPAVIKKYTSVPKPHYSTQPAKAHKRHYAAKRPAKAHEKKYRKMIPPKKSKKECITKLPTPPQPHYGKGRKQRRPVVKTTKGKEPLKVPSKPQYRNPLPSPTECASAHPRLPTPPQPHYGKGSEQRRRPVVKTTKGKEPLKVPSKPQYRNPLPSPTECASAHPKPPTPPNPVYGKQRISVPPKPQQYFGDTHPSPLISKVPIKDCDDKPAVIEPSNDEPEESEPEKYETSTDNGYGSIESGSDDDEKYNLRRSKEGNSTAGTDGFVESSGHRHNTTIMDAKLLMLWTVLAAYFGCFL